MFAMVMGGLTDEVRQETPFTMMLTGDTENCRESRRRKIYRSGGMPWKGKERSSNNGDVEKR